MVLRTTGSISGDGYVSHRHRTSTSAPGVILLHGYNATASVFNSYYGPTNDMVPQLVRHGMTALAIDAGGSQNWGNAAAKSAITAAKSFLHSDLGVPTGPVVLVGVSMGATVALNYAREFPSNVAGLALLYPACDLEDLIAATPSLETSINSTFGTTNATEREPFNPAANPSDLLDVNGQLLLPVRLWYSANDPTCRPGQVLAFADAIGAETTNMGDQAHNVIGMDPVQVSSWVRRQAG